METVDILILALVIISGLLAWRHGFTREVLSVTSWILATIFTMRLLPLAIPTTRQWVEAVWLADGLTIIAIFIVTLMVLSFIARHIAKAIKKSGAGMLDHTLGLIFGLIRGGLIVILLYMALSTFMPHSTQPAWITNARVYPLLQSGATAISWITPQEWRSVFDVHFLEDVPFDAMRTPQKKPEPSLNEKRNRDTHDTQDTKGQGYNTMDRLKLDRLLRDTETEK